MSTKDEIIRNIVHTMSYTDLDLLPDYQNSISGYTKNGLYFAVWDHRTEMLVEAAMSNPSIKILLIQRGNLWEFGAIFDEENGKLYILMSQDNLDNKRKDYEKTGKSTHYLYSLLHYNLDKNVGEQMELFDSPDNEEDRIADCEKMLGEYADKVNEVIVASFTYVNHIASKALLNVFDGNYNQISITDISDMLIADNTTASSNTLGNGKRDNNQDEKPLVKLLEK